MYRFIIVVLIVKKIGMAVYIIYLNFHGVKAVPVWSTGK